VPYRDLVEDGQVRGLLVAPDWYEPPHPQESPPMGDDPVGLLRPTGEISVPPGEGDPVPSIEDIIDPPPPPVAEFLIYGEATGTGQSPSVQNSYKLAAQSIDSVSFGTVAAVKPNDGFGVTIWNKHIQYEEPSSALPNGRLFMGWPFAVCFSDNLGESWRIIRVVSDDGVSSRNEGGVFVRADGSYLIAGVQLHPTNFTYVSRRFFVMPREGFDAAADLPFSGNLTTPEVTLPFYDDGGAADAYYSAGASYNADRIAIEMDSGLSLSIARNALPASVNFSSFMNPYGAAKTIPTQDGFVLIGGAVITRSVDGGQTYQPVSPVISDLFSSTFKSIIGGDLAQTGRIVATNFWNGEVVVSDQFQWSELSNWRVAALPATEGGVTWTRVIDAAYSPELQMWGICGQGSGSVGLVCLANEDLTQMQSYTVPLMRNGGRVVSLPPRRVVQIL
jgi:hypothetical protein